MELELGLALPNQTVKQMDLNFGYNNGVEMGERNEDEVESKGLSLLLWSGQPNEEDDDDGRWTRHRINHENINVDEIVGWPPVNPLRKELIHRHQGRNWMANIVPAIRSSMYVKVKMEGVPIGRKIDLRLFDSYQALTDTLIDMFAKYNSKHVDYTILYQDKQGDWMLAGDVPWETFVESVRRIEILRKNN